MSPEEVKSVKDVSLPINSYLMNTSHKTRKLSRLIKIQGTGRQSPRSDHGQVAIVPNKEWSRPSNWSLNKLAGIFGSILACAHTVTIYAS